MRVRVWFGQWQKYRTMTSMTTAWARLMRDLSRTLKVGTSIRSDGEWPAGIRNESRATEELG